MRHSDPGQGPSIGAAGPTVRSRARIGAVPSGAMAAAAALGLACYLAASAGLALVLAPLPAPVLWPSNAILLAALVVAPTGRWLLLLAAALFAHLVAEFPRVPPATTLGWFFGNATGAMAGAVLLQAASAGDQRNLASVRSVLAFCAAAVAAALVGSLLGGGIVRGVGWHAQPWVGRFFSNLLAQVALAPVILTWLQPARGPAAERERLREATCLLVALLAVSVIGSVSDTPSPALQVTLHLPVLFLLWAALRFGPRLTSLSFAVVAVPMIWAAAQGRGPLAQGMLEDDPLPVQIFLLTLLVALLFLAALAQSQREAQERICASEELFSCAFRGSPDAIAIARKSDGAVITANDRWLDLFGYSGELLAAGRVAPLATHLDEQARRTLRLLAHDDAPVRDMEVEWRDRHGQRRVGLLSTSVVHARDEVREVQILRDITGQRQAEREAREQRRQLTHLARAASLGGFSAAVAHELNQPLAAILSNAQAALSCLARQPPRTAELPAVLSDIVAATKQASALIQHLRQLMKNGEEHFELLDLNRVVMETLDLVGGEARLRHVALRACHAPNLPRVHGDAIQLQQVLLNLVLNAFHAMELGVSGERTVALSTHDGHDGTVRLEVADSGPGIAPDKLKRVFDPFYTTKASGMGLGLPICRKILAVHGGSLAVRSREGEGATFVCTLPAAAGPLA